MSCESLLEPMGAGSYLVSINSTKTDQWRASRCTKKNQIKYRIAKGRKKPLYKKNREYFIFFLTGECDLLFLSNDFCKQNHCPHPQPCRTFLSICLFHFLVNTVRAIYLALYIEYSPRIFLLTQRLLRSFYLYTTSLASRHQHKRNHSLEERYFL